MPFSNIALPPVDDSGDEEPASQSDRSEIQGTLKTLASKLDDLSTCNDLIAKHGAALQRSLSELEGLRVPVEGGEKIKAVNERATLFRITSNAMINVSMVPVAAGAVIRVSTATIYMGLVTLIRVTITSKNNKHSGYSNYRCQLYDPYKYDRCFVILNTVT